MIRQCLLVISAILFEVTALDNGLALTPPMGWMHWQRFRCITDCETYPDECISDNLFRKTADYMVSEGYLEAGYQYLIIDDCWSDRKRDSDGRLQPEPKRFPYGIKSLSDYVHSKGLKFGMYANYGSHTCAGYPGSIFNLKIDADTFAEWGVDFLKMDACFATGDIQMGYKKMSNYLNTTGRAVLFACSFPAYFEPRGIKTDYNKVSKICNTWRNYDNVEDSWVHVTKILDWFTKNQNRLQKYSGPGHWNDLDMLVIGNYGLSFEQSKSQMVTWAILASPLLISADLRTISPKFKNILLNRDIIAVNQDPLGIMGQLVATKDNIHVWTKPLKPNDGYYSYAIAILNRRIDGVPFRFSFNLTELNITNSDRFHVKDVFKNREELVTNTSKIHVRINPTGATLLIVTPTDRKKTMLTLKDIFKHLFYLYI